MLPILVAGGLAGATSTAVLHPLEVLRSRLTCDVTGQYRGALSAARQMVASEGMGSLYRGLGPSTLAILPEAAITYGNSLTDFESLMEHSHGSEGIACRRRDV